MRQAGRYLPEYRELQGEGRRPSWTSATRPAMAAEATLQPIRRFGLDAAILFSRHPRRPRCARTAGELRRGRGAAASADHGSRRDSTTLREEIDLERLAPVFEAIGRVKEALPAETTLPRLLRGSLDRGELHDRRQGHAGARTLPPRGLSRPCLHAGADRPARHGVHRLSRQAVRRPASTPCRSSRALPAR